MIVITGGAGFIGSNLIRALNREGITDILVVDNLRNGIKFRNLVACDIHDYLDKQDFLARIEAGRDFHAPIDAVLHQGACSCTTEWDGQYLMRNNYEYSKTLLHYCLARQIPFLYASSAAVYGAGREFREDPAFEHPLNIYGYSKVLFDRYVRKLLPGASSQIVGLRYFNVYGPYEQHKGNMASVAYQFYRQQQQGEPLTLFEGSDNFGNGEQRRDFVFVEDVAEVNLWFLRHRDKSGIFNVGTGRSQTFNDVANALIQCQRQGEIQYIPMPAHLHGRYQSFTEADISALREAGYAAPFKNVAEGVTVYLAWLDQHDQRFQGR